ncbi:MAG: hypothetical protein EA374_03215 [Acholeplasmatales bacterium]|nr:MAG: hypothetical protein EA374_03215 [Acholeplasmatales bacterium]
MIWLLTPMIIVVVVIGLFIDWSNRAAKRASMESRSDKLIPTTLEKEPSRQSPIKQVKADSLKSGTAGRKEDDFTKDYDDFFDVDDDFFKQYDDDPFDKK